MDYKNIAQHFGVLDRMSRAYIVSSCMRWNMSFSEYSLLLKLYSREGCHQEQLASLMAMDKGLLARTIKSLEKKGLIRRVQDEQDKRLKRIYFTDYGRSLKNDLFAILECWINRLSQGMEEGMIYRVMQGLSIAADNALQFKFQDPAEEEGKNSHEKNI